MTWQLIDNNEMERIHVREMHRDFPPGELKGVDVMERLRADGCYWPYACYDEAGRLLAYAFLCGLPGEPNVLLDYYAVLPAVRCRGLGAELLARLRGVCAGRWQGILIEAEDPAEAPDEGLAIRRLGFYTRAGARMLKWESRVFGVHYRLFCLQTTIRPPRTMPWWAALPACTTRWCPARCTAPMWPSGGRTPSAPPLADPHPRAAAPFLWPFLPI